MADINLTQVEADALMALEKRRVNNEPYDFPMGGGSLILPLQSPDKREQFSKISDLWRTLDDFMEFCNITQPPRIERGLFT